MSTKYPPSSSRVMRIIKLFFLALICYFFLFPLTSKMFGFFPDGVGWEVAENIVNRGGNATDCKKIFHLISHPFSPSAGEQRALCIYTYAKLTKDPTACELLMPSDYGLSCINQSMDLVFRESTDKTAEHVDDNANCSSYTSSTLRKDYCLFGKVHLTRKTTDCKPIQNETIRKACIMKFEAWHTYPSLRNSFYFGNVAEQ